MRTLPLTFSFLALAACSATPAATSGSRHPIPQREWVGDDVNAMRVDQAAREIPLRDWDDTQRQDHQREQQQQQQQQQQEQQQQQQQQQQQRDRDTGPVAPVERPESPNVPL